MRFLLFSLVALLFQQSFAQKNAPINSSEIIKQGAQLHDSGEYKKAMELYELVDRNDTNYDRSLYERSISCYLFPSILLTPE